MSLKKSAFYTDLGEMMKNPESASLFVAEIQKQERERIIKLLDEAKTYQQLELVIDRIKGETK